MRILLILLLTTVTVFPFAALPQSTTSCKTNFSIADDVGYIDDITINDREFDELPEEIEFYPEDLQDSKVYISGILESTKKEVPVKELHVEISSDGGETWHSVEGNKEWRWSFTPEIGKMYQLSFHVIRYKKELKPAVPIEKQVYISTITPSRVIKGATTTLSIKGKNFTPKLDFFFSAHKVKIIKKEFIDKQNIALTIKVMSDIDLDVDTLSYTLQTQGEKFKSNGHIWFVDMPNIIGDLKLECEEDTLEQSSVAEIYTKPDYLQHLESYHSGSATSQTPFQQRSEGYIAFLDDQTELSWEVANSVYPSLFKVTFYTPDMKKIKSFTFKNSNHHYRGSLKLSPSQLYDLYSALPAKLTKDTQNNPAKEKLLYYTDNFPGARFLFWQVEGISYISTCKGLRSAKVAQSKIVGLRMGAAPTGTVCDARNSLLSATKTKGSQGEAFYPGDTIELYGEFSLENSPWRPTNLVIDWGDSKYDVIDLADYDRDSALGCESVNSGTNYLNCVMGHTGENQMIHLKKEHVYEQAGRFKARVYVLPEDELAKVAEIAKKNYKETTSAFLQTPSKPFYYAMAENVKSDTTNQQHITPMQVYKKMQSSSDRIFEIYCNPLDIYIVKDPDANGPLTLTGVQIENYSSDEDLHTFSSLPIIQNTAISSQHNYSTMNNIDKELKSHTSSASKKEPTVDACDTFLFTKAKITYHGQGFIKVSWLVDGILLLSKEFSLGPTKNRDNLNYNDPAHWPKPIDATISLNSPRLPLLDVSKHHVKIVVETIDDPTHSKSDATLRLGIINSLTFSSAKKQKLSDTSSYKVTNGKKGEICYFEYPIENGNYIKIFSLKNLKNNNGRYSGRGKALFHLTNSKNGVGEYSVPIVFKDWRVDNKKRVYEGKLETNTPVFIEDIPNMKITISSLSGDIGKNLQAKLDIEINDKSLLSANTNKAIQWRDISTPLAYNGDLFIANKKLPLTHIGWSLFNISSESVSIDLSHHQGDALCHESSGKKWIGINLGESAKLYPYTFHLANGLSFKVANWAITDHGLCGEMKSSNDFSHILGDGKIGWKNLLVSAKNHNLSATYKGFYVDIPWPKVRLSGGDINLNYLAKGTKESQVSIHLKSDKQFKESYGNIDLSVKKIKSFEKIGKEWGILTESHLDFFDREKKNKIEVDVNNMFFTMFTTTGFTQENRPSTSISLKNQTIDFGGANLNVKSVTLKATQAHGASKKLSATFNASLTLEQWSESTTKLHSTISKRANTIQASNFQISSFTPVTRSYPLNDPINKSTVKDLKYISKRPTNTQNAFINLDKLAPFHPNADISLYPHLASLNANISNGDCSGIKEDTFSAHIDTHYFGDGPAIEATLRYGVIHGKSYWLTFSQADGLNIPLFPSIFLYKIRGGACYRFDPDDLVHGSGCNAKPNPSYGLGLAFGAGVKIGSENLIKVESTMIINPKENKVGFYGIKGKLLSSVDIHQGKLEYIYGSHFQATLGASFSLPSNDPLLKLDATNAQNGKIDLKMGGTYYLHVGTKEEPITGTLLIFNGDIYFMAGTDIKGVEVGLHSYLGFSTEGNEPCTKARADCASIGVDTNLYFGLHYDPFSFLLHADEDFDANACIDFGKLGTACVGIGASGYIDMGCCNPMKLAAGANIDFPSPLPNVGVGIGIIPADIDIDIDW